MDVSEIQDGLENVRDEVIKGLVWLGNVITVLCLDLLTELCLYRGVIAEKPSEALFTLDTTGSNEIRKSYKFNKPLKADEILAIRSAVPAIDSHKRPGTTDGVIEPSSKRRKKDGVSPKELERLKSVAYGGTAGPKDIVEVDGAHYDPWAIQVEEQDPRFSYLEQTKPIKAPGTLKEAPISLIKGISTLPAVVKPKGGSSYNPEFQDWEQVLTEEGAKEVEAEKKRLKEAALEQERQDRIAAAQDKRDDYQTEDESAWEGFESEYEGSEWLKPRRPERKTPAEKNKIKRRKEAERQSKRDAQAKVRAQQAQKIKDIVAKVEAESKAKASVIVARESTQDADDRVLRRRKLGKDA